MKKLITLIASLVLCCAMAFGLVACGGSSIEVDDKVFEGSYSATASEAQYNSMKESLEAVEQAPSTAATKTGYKTVVEMTGSIADGMDMEASFGMVTNFDAAGKVTNSSFDMDMKMTISMMGVSGVTKYIANGVINSTGMYCDEFELSSKATGAYGSGDIKVSKSKIAFIGEEMEAVGFTDYFEEGDLESAASDFYDLFDGLSFAELEAEGISLSIAVDGTTVKYKATLSEPAASGVPAMSGEYVLVVVDGKVDAMKVAANVYGLNTVVKIQMTDEVVETPVASKYTVVTYQDLMADAI